MQLAGLDFLTRSSVDGTTTTGYTNIYKDGSKDVFGFVVKNNGNVFQKAFLTEQWNQQGQKTTFYYHPYTSSPNPIVRLRWVVDGDGRTNSVYYVTNNAFSTNLISHIVDAFGRTNLFAYDSAGQLTDIIDVEGISSSFGYDASNRVTGLTTPYGLTSFDYADTFGTNRMNGLGRAVLVTKPDGGKELFASFQKAPGVVSSYPTNQVPVTTGFTNTFENSNLDIRNTFYWGPRQYTALSTTNINSFTTNDFRLARMQHWLRGEYDVSGKAFNIGNTVALLRDPSPDLAGAIEGQKTWFDYAGKTNSATEGTQSVPLFIGQVLPDGTTRFTRTERNSIGSVTNEISTYSAGGTVALRTNRYTYAANGIDVITITNALGVQVSSNAYNSYHQVVTNYNALNEMTALAYDSDQRLTTVNWPGGLVTTNTYGGDGYLARQVHVGFATNSYAWSNALIFTHTDPRGMTTTNTWDALERLRRVSFPDGTFTTNTYEKLDLVLMKDRMGYTNAFGYNAVRQMTAATNALGYYTLLDYCSCGSLNSVRDAANNYTYFFFDNAGRLANAVYPDGYAMTNRYNLVGQLTNVLDIGGASVTNWFNNQGLLLTSSNALGRIFLTTYDLLDRATNTVDANGVTVTNSFDNFSRLLTRGYPDGGLEKFGYSVLGLIAYTNQLDQVTRYGYDIAGRKIAETNANSEVVQLTYSGAGDLRTLTDGKNQTTSWGYDIFGRQTSKTNATGTEIFRFGYDLNGRLTNRWTATKGDTAYTYDAVGNLKTINYQVSPAINLAYDSLNRLTNMVDAVGTNGFTYNAVSQLLTEDGPWSSDTVSYTYTNRLRRSLGLVQPGTADWTNGYAYDAARRLTNITSQAGAFVYAYDSTRQLQIARLTLPNSAYITNSYDPVAQLLSTQLKNSGGTVLNSHSYGYNVASQRTTLTNTAGDYRNYAYDNIGQLKTASGFESGGAARLNETLGYNYDAAGNLNQRTNNALIQTFNVDSLNELSTINRSGTLTVAGNTTTTATNVTVNTSNALLYADRTFASTNHSLADGNNTFTTIAKNAVGLSDTNTLTLNLPGTSNFSYDLNGNLRTNGNQILEYDDENQLVTNWVASAWKSEFVYDVALRRRIQRDYGWSGAAWVKTNEVRFVFDGNLPIQHRDAGNTPTLTLTRGLDLSLSRQGAGGIGGLLAMTESSGTNSYYHADGSGNVSMLINANQLIVAGYLYDPFGRTLSFSGPKALINPYRFSSKVIHDLSGEYDFLFRWYNPSLQRWLNQDPLGEAGGLNLYGFVLNDPINLVDDSGLQPAPVQPRSTRSRIPGVVPDPAINREIEREMRARGLTRSQVELEREIMETQVARNTRDRDRMFLPNPPYLGNEPIIRPSTPRPPPQPPTKPCPENQPPNVSQNAPPVLWREGRTSPSNLKERPQDVDGVSFRANLSNPLPKGDRPVFRTGEDYFGIDTSRLPANSRIIPDANDPFHFGVKGATPQEIQKAVIPGSKGAFPP